MAESITVYVASGDVYDETMLSEQYDALLDEYSIDFGNLSYSGAQVLKAVDPIAYRVGFSDFTSDYDVVDIPADVWESLTDWDDVVEYALAQV
jgi:hypothetical protein